MNTELRIKTNMRKVLARERLTAAFHNKIVNMTKKACVFPINIIIQ